VSRLSLRTWTSFPRPPSPTPGSRSSCADKRLRGSRWID